MNRVRWKLVVLALAIMVLAGWGIWYRWFRPSIEQLMRRGIFAANRQDTATAKKMLDSVLSRDPSHHQALMMRGQLAREEGDRDLALSLWRKIPDAALTNAAMARYLEGTLLLDNGEARRAEQSLRKAVELNPAHLRSRETLLQLYVLQLREADVRKQLLGLREYQPWSLEQLLLFSMSANPVDVSKENQALLEKFTLNDPLDSASVLGLLKRRAVQGADDAEVITLAQSASKRMPENTELLGFAAGLLLHSADLAAAETVLGSTPQEGLVALDLLRSLGTYFADVRNWVQARVCFERLLQIEPDDLPSNYRLGLVLEALGEKEAGVKYLEKAKLLERLAARFEHIARQVELMNNKGQLTRDELAAPAIEVARLYQRMERPAAARLWLHQSLEWAPNNAAAQQFIREFGGNRLLAAVTNVELKNERRLLADSDAGSPMAAVPKGFVIRKSTGDAVATDEPSQIVFRDCHVEAGVDFQYFNGESGAKYLLESMGGGVAVIDYDGDGWPDLYFTQGARVPLDPADKAYQDRLFRNLGNGQFEDVTMSAGLGDNRYSQGCVAGDVDNDGHTDLLVANWGENVLYMNNGDGTFDERTAAAGLGGKQNWNSSLALADFNRDGNLDLYVVTYVQDALRICRSIDGRPGACHPRNFAAEPDFLYLNRGDGTFTEESNSTGIDVPDGKGLGIIVADFDRDGWPDIYVANDGTPNFVFRNQGASGGQLRFSDEGLTSGGAVSHEGLAQGSMGIAAGDYDEDGLLDLYVTNFYFEGSALYLNQGEMSFVDAIRAANLYACTRLLVGFGTQAADFNLDGKLDIFATNGHIDDFRFRGEPWRMPAQVFANRGRGTFTDQSRRAGPIFVEEQLGRGVARVDYDRDGKPDIVVSHLDRPAALMRNESEFTGNSLAIELKGVISNRDAIGAIISVHLGRLEVVREICGGDGYYASNDRQQIFGIGASTVVDKIEISWPSGQKSTFEQVAAGSKLLIVEQKKTP